MTTPDPTDRLRATLRELVGDPRDPAATVQVSVALLDEMDAALAAPAPDLLAAVEALAPVHVGQMYKATDHGAVEYRPDDCVYRGEVLALIESRSLSTSREADPDLDMAWELLAANIHAGGHSVRDAIAEHRAGIERMVRSTSREAGLDADTEVELMRAALHEQGIGCKPNVIHCRATHLGHANRLVSSLHAIRNSGTTRR